MDYRFVTRADVAAVRKKFKENNPITSAQMALGLCERLLDERDAYREVAKITLAQGYLLRCGQEKALLEAADRMADRFEEEWGEGVVDVINNYRALREKMK